MKKYVTIVIILTILIIPISATTHNAYYYQQSEEKFSSSKTVYFTPQDINPNIMDADYINGSLYYRETVEKTIWIGALQLPLGSAMATPDFSAIEKTIKFNTTITVDTLENHNISINIVAYNIINTEAFTATIGYTLYKGQIHEGDNLNETVVKPGATMIDQLDNGSYVPFPSIIEVLDNENNIYYSKIIVQLSVNELLNWSFNAKISINIEGINNPELYKLSLSRSTPKNNEQTTTIDNTITINNSSNINNNTSNTQLSSNTSNANYPINVITIVLTVITVNRIKKIRSKP